MVVALTVAAVVFGVTVLVTGSDPGLGPAEPDGRAVPLPGNRPLLETDVGAVRFDLALRGYRMGQVDQALRRTAYDIGYKDELIGVLQAEVSALREGRLADAEGLRRAREAALVPAGATQAGDTGSGGVDSGSTADPGWSVLVADGSQVTADGSSAGAVEPGDIAVKPLEFGRPESGRPDTGSGRAEPTEPAELADRAELAELVDRADAAGSPVDAPAEDGGPAVGTEAEAGDAAARTRPVRAGGSVIEAEDGDLAGATHPVRPAAAAQPEPSGSATGDGLVAGDGSATGDRPAVEDDPAGGDAADGGPAKLTRPTRASGPAEPSGSAEPSERM